MLNQVTTSRASYHSRTTAQRGPSPPRAPLPAKTACTLHVARSRTTYDHAVRVNEIVTMKGECELMPAYAVLERASLTFTNRAINGKESRCPSGGRAPSARANRCATAATANAASIRKNDAR